MVRILIMGIPYSCLTVSVYKKTRETSAVLREIEI
jgi:hypothetical protein